MTERNDTPGEGRIASGSFQPETSLDALLFSISHSLSQIRGMIHVSDSAADRLIHSERYSVEGMKNGGHR